MDRKGWLILIICTVLLVLNYRSSVKNSEELREIEAAKEKAEPSQEGISPEGEAGVTKVDEPNELESTPVPADKPVEEVTHTLETEHVIFTFSSLQGGISQALIKDEFVVGSDSEKVILNRGDGPQVGALMSGPDAYLDQPLEMKVEEGKSVSFHGQTKNGLTVIKTYSLKQDQTKPGATYQLALKVTLKNSSAAAINLADVSLSLGSAAPLYQREWAPQTVFFYHAEGSLEKETPSDFTGGMFSSERPTISVDQADVGMAGVMNQLFATIVTPSEARASRLWTKPGEVEIPESAGGGRKPSIRGAIGLPSSSLEKDAIQSFEYDIYMGPKRNTTLRAMGGLYGDVMDYGWFSWICRLFNSVLNWLHDVVYGKIAPVWGWGLSIVTLTVLIRICIWPLHNKSQRTMKKMSKLQPEMAKLKEKYADNPNKMNQETMKLYREFGVNPLGGCLPMLAQIPIFFGFYKMLQFAVELRGQEFLWWVKDLSQPDTIYTFDLPFSIPFLGTELPLNILPILMAVTMVIQMRMTPQTGDALQRRIFMLMPLMFFVFCYNFASALALYWTTQNIFSIGQTALMKRLPEPELKRSKKKKKSMAERVAEMQEQQKQMKKAKGSVVNSGDQSKKKRPPRTGG